MCGIFGYIHNNPTDMSLDAVSSKLKTLFVLSQTRGKEAAGLAIATSTSLAAYKDSTSAETMIKTKQYQNFLDRSWDSRADKGESIACIGHTRLVTNGSQVVDENNQPVDRGRVMMVHNGIITNPGHVWEKSGMEQVGEVDTQAAAAFIEGRLAKDKDLTVTAKELLSEVYGESTFASLFTDRDTMLLTSNTGSMFFCISQDKKEMFFVSERVIAYKVIDDSPLKGFSREDIVQVRPGDIVCMNTKTLEYTHQNVADKKLAAPAYAQDLGMMRKIEEKSQRLSDIRDNMQRCTRCILPETMPFIKFDDEGVCNYCHTYKPVQPLGLKAFEERISGIKRVKGEPDCILAFSGGRDSSAGMHLMVKELDLKPIAFSYDWGMVTDLGRRNQARMCDALSVEHIWISADLKMKRTNIRRNVNAWMKRPRLGTIPLFMAGDKQYFYHANQTMKHTGMDHMFMCVNHLEKTDFKVGFADTMPKGLQADVNVEHIHSLPFSAIMSLAWYYGRETVMNPRYFNLSIPDTLGGFGSYYLMKQPHIDIFEYLPWEEKEVNRILGLYDWEYAKGVDTSWRIGDGTAPFYNYVYHEVAGFTEFDALRSNQIREGHLTRDEGLALAKRDNMPRWESMREYCALINVDFEDCVRAVNRMPKLYENLN